MYKRYIKRLLDLLISIPLLLVLSPILLVVTLLLMFANKGAGAFFTQKRPGRGGKIFEIIKFKSMTDERDADGNLLPDDQRLTPIGRFVRSASIDELPQLINVIMGDMSLIGPRPLLVEYLPLYNERQAHRHDVRPGITGWAQCHGRNELTWQQKFELDVWYVEHCTFMTDARVFMLSLLKVVKREGISAQGVATMEPFRGN